MKLPALSPNPWGLTHYFPIEWFKETDWIVEKGRKAQRSFLSSGTTSQDRSVSHFSAEGLALYKQNALEGFRRIVPRDRKGISLVPPFPAWPTSSLTQMLTWIGQEWDVRFVNDDVNPVTTLPTTPETPCFVFGTAFHYIELYDRGFRTALHPQSLVIETGGTKGRTRSFTQAEVYELLAEMFSLPQDRIVSEYSMCELACQAYKTGPHERFRFAEGVRTFVMQGFGELLTSGRGALVIWDPTRIDYPWPLRTQDLVHLNEDGTFALEGRVPQAPLKGCSLMVDSRETD